MEDTYFANELRVVSYTLGLVPEKSVQIFQYLNYRIKKVAKKIAKHQLRTTAFIIFFK